MVRLSPFVAISWYRQMMLLYMGFLAKKKKRELR